MEKRSNHSDTLYVNTDINMLAISDVSIMFRLSIRDPSKDKLVLPAYAHIRCHCAINDRECMKLHFDNEESNFQRRVVSLGRQIKHNELSVV